MAVYRNQTVRKSTRDTDNTKAALSEDLDSDAEDPDYPPPPDPTDEGLDQTADIQQTLEEGSSSECEIETDAESIVSSISGWSTPASPSPLPSLPSSPDPSQSVGHSLAPISSNPSHESSSSGLAAEEEEDIISTSEDFFEPTSEAEPTTSYSGKSPPRKKRRYATQDQLVAMQMLEAPIGPAGEETMGGRSRRNNRTLVDSYARTKRNYGKKRL